MSETRATMRTRVEKIVGTAITATVNQGLKDGCRLIQDKHNWRMMEATTTITISDGDSTFTLPSDFKQEMNPEMSDTDLTGYKRMKKALKNQIEERDSDDDGRPLLYRIWNQTGYLYATADDTYTFSLEYYKYFNDLDDDDEPGSDTDFTTFLNEMHEAIEAYAISRGFERLNNFGAAALYQNDDPRALGKFEKVVRRQLRKELDYELANVSLVMEEPG